MQQTFYIVGLQEFQRDLKQTAVNARAVYVKALNQIGMKIAPEAKKKAPRGVSSPGIKGAIGHKVTPHPLKLEVGVIKGRADYAIFVEKGTRPHFPPPKALERWARIKLGASDASSAAYLIARKISKTGTAAQPFLEPALKENMSFLWDRLEQAHTVIVKMMAGKR